MSDHRIRIVADGYNKGLAVRLNEAIGLARGEYFARMDQDDICHPDRFALQVAALTGDQSIDLCATRCVTISQLNRLVGTLPSTLGHSDICRKPWVGFYMPHPTWMGKVAWFRRHGYANPGPYCSEDQELLLRAHRVSHYHVLPDYLLAYRIRDQVDILKLFRTRNTLRRIQSGYFYENREYLLMFLADMACVARIAKDVFSLVGEVFLRKKPYFSVCKSEGSVDFLEWQGVINGVVSRCGGI